MAINFPATAGQPTDGSFTHSEAGVAYFWDGDSWVADGRNVTPQTDLTALSVTTNPAGNSALSYDNTTGVFSYTPPQLTVSSLTDVSFSVIENGWALTYSNGNWTASGVPSELGELDNVAATAPNNGDVLTWNAPNARWQPAAVSGGSGGGGASVTVSDTAPGSGTAGDLWWNSDSGRLKIYYQDTDSTQWVDASPPLSSGSSQVQSDWAETDSNDDAFIKNKPTIPAAQVNSDWNATSGVEQILNKPTLFSGSYNDLSNKPTIPDTGIISVKDAPYNAAGDGSTDDTSAIQSALNSNHKAIYFPAGDYVISSALTSSLNGRKIYGEGTITTTATALSNVGSSILLNAFVFTNSEYVDFSLDCNGNNLIEVFAQFNQCLDPHIHHCRVRDLESPAYPTGGKAIAFELFNQGANAVDTGAKITDNYITNLIAHDDSGGVVGRGMARGIAFDTDQTLTKPILIADNVIDTVAGHEGDAISIMSISGSNYLNANVFITGNHIKDFNRRGCKIKFNSAVVSNNTFYNTWTSEPLSTNPNNDPVVQGVVDLVNGEHHIVSGNKFINTEYMSQIKIVTSGSETVSNCVIKDNVFTRIGFQTSASLMYISSSTSTNAADQGTNLTIKDNSFDVPGFSGYCIRVVRTKNVMIADNTGIISSGATGVHVPGSAANNNLTNVNNNFLVAT